VLAKPCSRRITVRVAVVAVSAALVSAHFRFRPAALIVGTAVVVAAVSGVRRVLASRPRSSELTVAAALILLVAAALGGVGLMSSGVLEFS